MAFTRPVAGADISAADFGQPVYDQMIRCGANRRTIQASLPNNAYTDLSWTTTIADTNGFVTSPVVFTIPTGKGGLYVATIAITMSTVSSNSYVSIYLGGERADLTTAGGGRFCGSFGPVPAVEGTACYFAIYNGSGAALTATSSNGYLYRVGM